MSRKPEHRPSSLPDGYPDATTDWRENAKELMETYGGVSPLPTRQLRRATARQMGRVMASIARKELRRGR